MSYGPTTTPTASPLAFDGEGKARLWWDSGLATSTLALPRIPKLLLDLETPEGETASAMFPSGRSRRLVADPGRELVLEHWARLTGPNLGATIGAHLITEQRSDGLVVGELIPSGGVCDPKVAGSWPGCVRFRKLRLRILTPGWGAVGIDLGPEGDHYFAMGAACAIRFVLYPLASNSRVAAQRLLDRADLVLPDPFPGLGPGEHVLPRSLNARQDPLNQAPHNGPFWPDSAETKGYAEGGDQIYPVGGYECSPAAAHSYANDVTRVLSRGGLARVHAADGRTIQHHEWPTQGKPGVYKLFDNRWSVDPWNWAGLAGTVVAMYGWNRGSQAPSTPQFRELNPGPSQSRALATKYKGHDVAHLARVRAIGVPAWYQCRSWAGRKLIEWNAHDVLHAYTLLDMVLRVQAAEANPGRGVGEYLREIAWLQGSIADFLSITSTDDSDRPVLQAWSDLAIRYQSAAILLNGFPHMGLPPNTDNGVPYAEGLGTDYAACAWFQLAFYACGIHDLWTASGGPSDHVDSDRFAWMLGEGLIQGIDNPAMPMRNGSPPNYPGVGKRIAPGSQVFVAEMPITARSATDTYGTPGSGSGHAIHDWTHLALWKRALIAATRPSNSIGRPEAMALKIGPRFPSIATAKASWRSQPNPWNVIAAVYL